MSLLKIEISEVHSHFATQQGYKWMWSLYANGRKVTGDVCKTAQGAVYSAVMEARLYEPDFNDVTVERGDTL